ncbi:DNA-binding response regulator, partial [Lactobacillus salivarius]|nr:DNA-binding response regulator [Ligilactobacillus salivarius]
MLKVLILEDNNLQRKTISQIVQNRIMINNTDKSYDMEIAISTDN